MVTRAPALTLEGSEDMILSSSRTEKSIGELPVETTAFRLSCLL